MKGVATKENEIFGKFFQGGLSSKKKYIDYLKENTQIRLDNGQNKLIVYIIHVIRFIKNFKKIVKDY